MAVAAHLREHTEMPVSAVGMLDTPFQAEHVLATGQADVVRGCWMKRVMISRVLCRHEFGRVRRTHAPHHQYSR